MDASELKEILDQHGLWLQRQGGQQADLRGAYLRGANLRWANLSGANLYGADLRWANLRGADLRGITVNWISHALLSEILWRAADTPERQMLAAFIGRRTDWCWSDWLKFDHPEWDWALGVLRGWVKPGDDAPDVLRVDTLAA